jgi:hypothetical protein
MDGIMVLAPDLVWGSSEISRVASILQIRLFRVVQEGSQDLSLSISIVLPLDPEYSQESSESIVLVMWE